MLYTTVTLYIVTILVVQNTKSLGTHVNMQFNNFLSLTNVNNLHYFYLARSILSITSFKHVYNHDKIERKICVIIIIDRYKRLSLMLPQPMRPNLLV
jgi:hypothetical protein